MDTSKIEYFKMHKTNNFQAPEEIDWRDLGGVTEVYYIVAIMMLMILLE